MDWVAVPTRKNVIYVIALLAGSLDCATGQTNRTLLQSEPEWGTYAGMVVDATTGMKIPSASIAVCSI